MSGPTLTAPVSFTYTSDPTQFLGINLSETGANADAVFTLSVSTADDQAELETGVPRASIVASSAQAVTFTATLEQASTYLSNFVYVDDVAAEEPITISATDSLGHQAVISLTPVPVLSPVLSAPYSVYVGTCQQTLLPEMFLTTDNEEPGDTRFTIDVEARYGILSDSAAGVTGSGGHTLIITGEFDQVNAALAAMTLTEPGTSAYDNVSLDGTDQYGETAQGSSTGIQVEDVPTLTAPAAILVTAGLAATLTGVSVTELLQGVQNEAYVTLTDHSGLLNVTDISGLEEVSGQNSTTLIVGGVPSEVNLALASLTETEPTAVSDVITLTANDPSSAFPATPATIAVAAQTAASPFAIAAPKTATLAAAKPVSLSSITLSGATGDLTLSLSDTYGLLSATGAGISGAGTTHLTLTGTEAQINAGLATLTDTDYRNSPDHITLSAGSIAATIAVALSPATLSGLNLLTKGDIAFSLTASPGAVEVLEDGSADGYSSFGASALQLVLNRGVADWANISGGIQAVFGGAKNTQLHSGYEFVALGGVAQATIIRPGGYQYVLYGGTATATTLAGGVALVGPGATLSGIVDFASAGSVLVLDNPTLSSVVIDGFGQRDAIIFAADSFSPEDSVTLGAGNILTLDLGGSLETLALDPTANYSGETFSLVADSLNQVVLLAGTATPRLSFLAPAIAGESLAIAVGTLVSTAIGDLLAGAPVSAFTAAVERFAAQGTLESSLIASLGSVISASQFTTLLAAATHQ